MPPDNRGWFESYRSEDADELARTNGGRPLLLLWVIARRIKWKRGFNRHGLKIGEAMLGDFKEYGMSHGQYRSALKVLEGGGFATFKRTNRGTIARLCDSRVFGVRTERDDNQDDSPRAVRRQLSNNRTREDIINSKLSERNGSGRFETGEIDPTK